LKEEYVPSCYQSGTVHTQGTLHVLTQGWEYESVEICVGPVD